MKFRDRIRNLQIRKSYIPSIAVESQIDVIKAEKRWDALNSEWNDLVDRCERASIFMTWEWLRPWWRNYKGPNDTLYLVTVRIGGRLVGVAPLYRHRVAHSIYILGIVGDSSEDSEYLDIITDDAYGDLIPIAITDYLMSKKTTWHIARFSLIRSESPTIAGLQRAAKEKGYYTTTQKGTCLSLDIPAEWDEYLTRASKKIRKKIRVQFKWMSEQDDVAIELCRTAGGLTERLNSLFELHQRRWEQADERGVFSEESRRRFYKEMAEGLAQKDRLRLYSLRLGGKLVAHEFNFVYKTRMYCLQMGYDTDFSDQSVGTTLRACVIKDCSERGVRCYDFLGGDDPYKRRWGAKPDEIRCVIVVRSGWAMWLYCVLPNKFEDIRDNLRECIPEATLDIKRGAQKRIKRLLHAYHLQKKLMGKNTPRE